MANVVCQSGSLGNAGLWCIPSYLQVFLADEYNQVWLDHEDSVQMGDLCLAVNLWSEALCGNHEQHSVVSSCRKWYSWGRFQMFFFLFMPLLYAHFSASVHQIFVIASALHLTITLFHSIRLDQSSTDRVLESFNAIKSYESSSLNLLWSQWC